MLRLLKNVSALNIEMIKVNTNDRFKKNNRKKS